MAHFIVTRQKYLMDPARAGSVQANTVLITGIPAKYLTPAALRKTFDQLPGGVKQIWINRFVCWFLSHSMTADNITTEI